MPGRVRDLVLGLAPVLVLVGLAVLAGLGWLGGLDGRHTLRTQGFREQLARLEASQEVKFEPKPVFLKRLSDVAKIGFEADFGSPETVRVWPKCAFQKAS